MARWLEWAPFSVPCASIARFWSGFRSGAYLVPIAIVSFLLLGIATFLICLVTASLLGSMSWEDCTSWSDSCFPWDALLPRARVIIVSLLITTAVEALTSLASTATAILAITQREMGVLITTGFLFLIAFEMGIASAVIVMNSALRNYPPDVQMISGLRPELSVDSLQKGWQAFSDRGHSIAALLLFVCTGALQIAAVCARHWVPSPWRLPNPWQPYVDQRGKTVVYAEARYGNEDTELVDLVNSGPLAQQFVREEKRWGVAAKGHQTSSDRKKFTGATIYAMWKSSVASTHRVSQSSNDAPGGPQFDSSDRYYGSMSDWGVLKILVLIFNVIILSALCFETARFAVDHRYGRPCKWTCKLAFFYPWPTAIWIACLVLATRNRVALNYRLVGLIRIHHLFIVGFLVCTGLWGTAAGALVARDSEHNQAFVNWNIASMVSAVFMLIVLPPGVVAATVKAA